LDQVDYCIIHNDKKLTFCEFNNATLPVAVTLGQKSLPPTVSQQWSWIQVSNTSSVAVPHDGVALLFAVCAMLHFRHLHYH
jgi:hypothetical protein